MLIHKINSMTKAHKKPTDECPSRKKSTNRQTLKQTKCLQGQKRTLVKVSTQIPNEQKSIKKLHMKLNKTYYFVTYM